MNIVQKGKLYKWGRFHFVFCKHEWLFSWWWCKEGTQEAIYRGGVGFFRFSFGTRQWMLRLDSRRPRLSLR